MSFRREVGPNKPQDDDEAIEQVESVLNVAEEAVSDHLE